MAKSAGSPLAEKPLGEIQTIEARAKTESSQSGINRRGHQSSKITYVLQMGDIKFRITDTFFETLQPNRLYRAFAVNDDGLWNLLSIETLE